MEGFNRQKLLKLHAVNIELEGRIQGVGFRPFLYRLAVRSDLCGWVRNCTSGVQLHLEGRKNNLEEFLDSIRTEAPPASRIDSIKTMAAEVENHSGFSIIKSLHTDKNHSGSQCSEISPDLAVCPDCLNDIISDPRRIDYPFTNCTNCGPRFSIIKGLPYDRPKTTMEPFAMCDSCLREYENVMDRRFHAQPNSCMGCGPEYTLYAGTTSPIHGNELYIKTGEIIKRGGIAVIKGIGGYHLACDPFNRDSVKNLRNLKNREGKPFAVMFSGIDALREHAELTVTDIEILQSPESPIVLLRQLKTSTISSEVNRDLDLLGCFLPYTPFHHVFFRLTGIKAIILTSGNISGAPVIKSDKKALELFLKNADAILTYNREIHNRCDDSVGFTANGNFALIRRSRGYVPDSIKLNIKTDSILAAGGDLKNTFCIGKGNKAIPSQHIGDLSNPETFQFYKYTINRFKDLFNFSPDIVAHDLHPGYRSSYFAKDLGITAVPIQHHHAHIASCLAENMEKGPVIGFSFDGTGYGDDGNIWGGEVFICTLSDYERKFHLKYIPLPGGDMAVKEPWRTALSALLSAFGERNLPFDMPFLKKINPSKIRLIMTMIDRDINSPLSSSMGRLFDTAAAMLDICTFCSFEAEGPLRIESIRKTETDDFYPLPLSLSSGEIDTSILIKAMAKDILNRIPPSEVSGRFHNSIIRMVADTASVLKKETGINTAALSGGVFNNRRILEGCTKILGKNGFKVLTQTKVPSGDGGLSLGQLAVAAEKIEKGVLECV